MGPLPPEVVAAARQRMPDQIPIDRPAYGTCDLDQYMPHHRTIICINWKPDDYDHLKGHNHD